jgi:putative lipoprotein (rSAM/lipoprotein system)
MYGCPPAPEYGVPVMEFRISGKAIDARTEEPVKGIAVTYITEDKYESPDTTWTSDNGEFLIESYCFPSDKMTLKFTDVDGAENGEYSVGKAEVTLVRKEENQDGWMVGIFAADDVQVKLDPVQPADPE